MIEAPGTVGMAAGIHLSTLEPVQQLGTRIAQLLSGELSRLRADVAFSIATGAAVHAADSQIDAMRATQLSSISQQYLGLTTQTITDARRAASAQINDRQIERDDGRREAWSSNDNLYDSESSAALILALTRALRQMQQHVNDEGLSGSLVVCVLPMAGFLDTVGPAAGVGNTCANQHGKDLLILCLAFDGFLGDSRQLWGFAYADDRLTGTLEARWSDVVADKGIQDYLVQVSQPCQAVSPLQCLRQSDQSNGMRIRIEACPGEPRSWYWHQGNWSWL